MMKILPPTHKEVHFTFIDQTFIPFDKSIRDLQKCRAELNRRWKERLQVPDRPIRVPLQQRYEFEIDILNRAIEEKKELDLVLIRSRKDIHDEYVSKLDELNEELDELQRMIDSGEAEDSDKLHYKGLVKKSNDLNEQYLYYLRHCKHR